MRKFKLSSPIVIDTDCLSSFLWIRQGDLIPRILQQTIYIPESVIQEIAQLLRYSDYSWMPQQLDGLLPSGMYSRISFSLSDPATQEWVKLTSPRRKKKRLGNGEAAAISYVRFHGGTVASNNLADIVNYCNKYSIEIISTDDILCLGVVHKYISEVDASRFWQNMKQHKTLLPTYEFSESYRRFLSDLPK